MAPTNSRGGSASARKYEAEITSMIRARRIPREIEKQKVRALSKRLAKETIEEVCERFLPSEERDIGPFLDELRAMINEEYSRTEVDEDQKKAIRLRPTQYLALMLEVNRFDPKRRSLDLKKQKAEIKRWKREHGCSQARRKAGFRLSSYWWRTKRRMRTADGSEDMSEHTSDDDKHMEAMMQAPAPTPAKKAAAPAPAPKALASRRKTKPAIAPLTVPAQPVKLEYAVPAALPAASYTAPSYGVGPISALPTASAMTPFTMLQFFNQMDSLGGDQPLVKLEDGGFAPLVSDDAIASHVPDGAVGAFDASWPTYSYPDIAAERKYPVTGSLTAGAAPAADASWLCMVPERTPVSMTREMVHGGADGVVPGF